MQSDMRAAIATIVEDHESLPYSIRLTRLVDEEATYTLTVRGQEPMEFPGYDEAAARLVELRAQSRVEALLAAIAPTQAVMVEALQKCREQFASYAAQHRAKGTSDSLTKAAVNEGFVSLCDRALS